MNTLVSHTFATCRHTTHYLEVGPSDGPLIILLHGWPELSVVWRAQMAELAAEGWRCVAPDMRGYGRSSVPAPVDAYTNHSVVLDMAELHDHLGGEPAIWIGHDWGSVIVGALASHEPRRCRRLILISVPYFPDANALQTLVPLVDRTIYPIAEYPDGQWDYYRYYKTHFESAVGDLDADIAASLASVFQASDRGSVGNPAPQANITRQGGRFGAAHRAPPAMPDPRLWPDEDFRTLVSAFESHGFGPPCAWYLNDDANVAYAHEALDNGRLSMPVLFVNGDYDPMNSIVKNALGDPMRAACADLTISYLRGGHWLPLECKTELAAVVLAWLKKKAL